MGFESRILLVKEYEYLRHPIFISVLHQPTKKTRSVVTDSSELPQVDHHESNFPACVKVTVKTTDPTLWRFYF